MSACILVLVFTGFLTGMTEFLWACSPPPLFSNTQHHPPSEGAIWEGVWDSMCTTKLLPVVTSCVPYRPRGPHSVGAFWWLDDKTEEQAHTGPRIGPMAIWTGSYKIQGRRSMFQKGYHRFGVSPTLGSVDSGPPWRDMAWRGQKWAFQVVALEKAATGSYVQDVPGWVFW